MSIESRLEEAEKDLARLNKIVNGSVTEDWTDKNGASHPSILKHLATVTKGDKGDDGVDGVIQRLQGGRMAVVVSPLYQSSTTGGSDQTFDVAKIYWPQSWKPLFKLEGFETALANGLTNRYGVVLAYFQYNVVSTTTVYGHNFFELTAPSATSTTYLGDRVYTSTIRFKLPDPNVQGHVIATTPYTAVQQKDIATTALFEHVAFQFNF